MILGHFDIAPRGRIDWAEVRLLAHFLKSQGALLPRRWFFRGLLRFGLLDRWPWWIECRDIAPAHIETADGDIAGSTVAVKPRRGLAMRHQLSWDRARGEIVGAVHLEVAGAPS